MDKDKENPDKQHSCGQLPGTDSDIEYIESQPIEEEDPELAVRAWIPLAEVLKVISKLFPPRR